MAVKTEFTKQNNWHGYNGGNDVFNESKGDNIKEANKRMKKFKKSGKNYVSWH